MNPSPHRSAGRRLPTFVGAGLLLATGLTAGLPAGPATSPAAGARVAHRPIPPRLPVTAAASRSR